MEPSEAEFRESPTEPRPGNTSRSGCGPEPGPGDQEGRPEGDPEGSIAHPGISGVCVETGEAEAIRAQALGDRAGDRASVWTQVTGHHGWGPDPQQPPLSTSARAAGQRGPLPATPSACPLLGAGLPRATAPDHSQSDETHAGPPCCWAAMLGAPCSTEELAWDQGHRGASGRSLAHGRTPGWADLEQGPRLPRRLPCRLQPKSSMWCLQSTRDRGSHLTPTATWLGDHCSTDRPRPPWAQPLAPHSCRGGHGRGPSLPCRPGPPAAQHRGEAPAGRVPLQPGTAGRRARGDGRRQAPAPAQEAAARHPGSAQTAPSSCASSTHPAVARPRGRDGHVAGHALPRPEPQAAPTPACRDPEEHPQRHVVGFTLRHRRLPRLLSDEVPTVSLLVPPLQQ